MHTVLLLVNLPAAYSTNTQSQQPIEWWVLAVRPALDVYAWALITPIILWLGFVFRIAQPHLLRNIFIHLIVSFLAGTFRLVIYKFGLWVFGFINPETIISDLSNSVTIIQALTISTIHYPSIIGIQQAYLYFQESRERAFRLQQAELEMLKMQLHPHFFFNTLNAISALNYRSPKEANRMISQLGNMFRASLRKDKTQEVSLEEELEFLQAFLQIHQTLMGKRLQIEWQIEPETLKALVPNLILQPLAENAIEHGISPLEEGGRIEIRVAKKPGNLLLQVRDSGIGFSSENRKFEGIGLSITEARLESLYNGKHKFSIDKSADGGTIVKIEIPFRDNKKEINEY